MRVICLQKQQTRKRRRGTGLETEENSRKVPVVGGSPLAHGRTVVGKVEPLIKPLKRQARRCKTDNPGWGESGGGDGLGGLLSMGNRGN